MPLVSVIGVSLGYNGVPVLRNVNFRAGTGDYVCVTGENGSGKSTLIRGILRLTRPLEGRIEYGDGLVPERIGYMPQRNAAGAQFPAGAFEVVLSGRLALRGIRPFFTPRDKASAADTMKRLGVYGLRDKNFGELSGGQQQRILLARALCAEGRLLILDEPAAGLDPIAASDFYGAVGEARSCGDIAVIMVTHDVSRAISEATHVLHFYGGSAVFSGKDDFISGETGRKYLGSLK